MAAVNAFQTGDIVFNKTAQSHYFDRMSTKRVLVVVAQGHEQEGAGQKTMTTMPTVVPESSLK